MTEHDPNTQPEPEHAKHLRAILEREAMLRAADATPPKPTTPMLARVPVVAIVGLIFSTVMANVARTWTPDPVEQTAVAQVQATRVSVLTAAEQIEGFRRERGRLPRSLDEVGLPQDRFEYTTDGEAFRIQAAAEAAGAAGAGVAPVYDSETGPEPILRALAAPAPVEPAEGP